jgi:hypothetical protein
MRTRSSVLALGVAAALVVGIGAPATAKGVGYKGKTAQGLEVTFRATAGKVSGFKATVRSLCISAPSGKSLLEFYPVLLQSPVKRTGKRFTIVFTGSNSTHITVKGKIKDDKANGSVKVAYTKTLGMTPGGLLMIGACSAETTWSAKVK